jgi:AcrR family transcriptional regulator
VPRPTVRLERRDQILDGLADVASIGGLRAASLNDVAKAAGMTKSALHHFFDSKEQIEVAFVRRIGQRYTTNLKWRCEREKARCAEHPPYARAEVLEALVRHHFEAPPAKAERLLNMWLDFWGAAATRPELRATVHAIQEDARDIFTDAILFARPALATMPRERLRLLAAAVLAIVEGGLLQWRVAHGSASPLPAEDLARTLAFVASAHVDAWMKVTILTPVPEGAR